MELFVQAANNFFETNSYWFNLAIIPFSAALIGWFTNVLALWMTFYPLEKTGFERLYWQGIIPSRAGKMAAISVDLMVGKLIDLKEIFNKIRPERIADQVFPLLEPMVKEVMDRTLTEKMPLPWAFLPEKVKMMFYQEATLEIPHAIKATIADIKENIETLFDVKSMVVTELENDKTLLNQIFLECGEKEFRFLERSGLYFGFCFGLIQMMLWHFFHDFPFSWLMLPIGGLFVGYLTNWLALTLIFKPQQPIKIGFFKIQGLFLKRQKAVAATYSEIVATRLLTTEKIFNNITKGKNKDLLQIIIQKNVNKSVDNIAGFLKSFIQIVAGVKSYEYIKSETTTVYQEILPKVIAESFDYMDTALDMKNTLNDKMSNLSATEFEGFLHPVFQEDELKLILIGAVLGMFAGFLQILFLL